MMSTMLVLMAALNMLPPPSLPLPESWIKVQECELEVRADDFETLFVGVIIDYRNSSDASEAIRVFSRYVPIVSRRSKKLSGNATGGSFTTSTVEAYHRAAEKKALERAHQSIDAFAFVRWHVTVDRETGVARRQGLVESWLLNQDGNWAYAQSYTGSITQAPLSEPWILHPTARRIVVGLVFSLGDVQHVVRADQGILALLALREEKSHATHAKR